MKTKRENETTEENDKPQRKKERLEGKALEELRESLRERKRKQKEIPDFKLKPVGEDARLELPSNERSPLFMRDFQSLLLYSLMGPHAPIDPSGWCKFERLSKISKIVCLVIDGLDCQDFEKNEEAESLKASLPFQLELKSSYADNFTPVDDLCIVPVSSRNQRKMCKDLGKVSRACTKGLVFKRVIEDVLNPDPEKSKKSDSNSSVKLEILLSASQMIAEGYPLPIEGPLGEKYSNFVHSKDKYDAVTESSPLYAVDCEMCLTDKGKLELTKVCVVDSDMNEIYHTLVKPRNPIVNYLTMYSGITAEMLEGVDTRLEHVQQALRKLLPADAIWVGQSLNGDLLALEMMHPYVIDTSVIFNITGNRRQKTNLKKLSEMFLGEIIQDKGADGHDPKEDAIAAMKLTLMKIEKGAKFGDSVQAGVEQTVTKSLVSTTIFKEIKNKDKRVSIFSTDKVLEDYKKYWTKDEGPNASLISCESEKEAIEKSCTEASSENQLVLCHVNASSLEEKKLKKAKKWIKKMLSSVPENGIFVTLWTGSATEKAFVGVALNKAQID